MNVYDGIHWNIYDILPYQRMFNMINSERLLGKTYTTQMYMLDKAIDKGQEFVYLCRTIKERDENILGDAFDKVIQTEFSGYAFEIDKYTLSLDGQVLGRCIALSEADKIKKRNYPNVYNMMFDEYIIAPDSTAQYVGGMREPNLLLIIYHTIDRDSGRLKCFMLANTLEFYNPYHMHKAFAVPRIEVGQIWYNKFLLFQRPQPSEALRDIKNKSLFEQMIDGTDYGDYANNGTYIFENKNFVVDKLPSGLTYFATICYNTEQFGVWHDTFNNTLYISTNYEPTYLINIALSVKDLTSNSILSTKAKTAHVKFLQRLLSNGRVYYVGEALKAKLEDKLFKL